jgi:SAM-dependent methyltransferase
MTEANHQKLILDQFTRQATVFSTAPAMLERARRLAADKGVTNVAWRQADVYPMPYEDGSFTIVTTRFSCHHFLDPAAVLQEMVRVCAPGGRIVVVDDYASEDPAKAAAFNRLEKLRDPSHSRALSLTELKGLFGTAGLPDPDATFYELRGNVPSLLARSFPNPGDDLEIIEMFKASAADDRLGVPVRLDGDEIYYAYPVAILAATRPA